MQDRTTGLRYFSGHKFESKFFDRLFFKWSVEILVLHNSI